MCVAVCVCGGCVCLRGRVKQYFTPDVVAHQIISMAAGKGFICPGTYQAHTHMHSICVCVCCGRKCALGLTARPHCGAGAGAGAG